MYCALLLNEALELVIPHHLVRNIFCVENNLHIFRMSECTKLSRNSSDSNLVTTTRVNFREMRPFTISNTYTAVLQWNNYNLERRLLTGGEFNGIMRLY